MCVRDISSIDQMILSEAQERYCFRATKNVPDGFRKQLICSSGRIEIVLPAIDILLLKAFSIPGEADVRWLCFIDIEVTFYPYISDFNRNGCELVRAKLIPKNCFSEPRKKSTNGTPVKLIPSSPNDVIFGYILAVRAATVSQRARVDLLINNTSSYPPAIFGEKHNHCRQFNGLKGEADRQRSYMADSQEKESYRRQI